MSICRILARVCDLEMLKKRESSWTAVLTGDRAVGSGSLKTLEAMQCVITALVIRWKFSGTLHAWFFVVTLFSTVPGKGC